MSCIVIKMYGHTFWDQSSLRGSSRLRTGSFLCTGSFLRCSGRFLLCCCRCGLRGGRGARAAARRRLCRLSGGRALWRPSRGCRRRLLFGCGGDRCLRRRSRLTGTAAFACLHWTLQVVATGNSHHAVLAGRTLEPPLLSMHLYLPESLATRAKDWQD